MADNLYADGVTDVTVVGPISRIRFHTLVPNPEGKGDPMPVPAFSVVMPLEAVATLSDALPRLTDKLVESGRLKKVARTRPTPN